MGKDTGILLNEKTGDLDIRVKRDANGMIVQGMQIGDVTKQNMGIIIRIQPGEIKWHPLVGVGIDNMLLSRNRLLKMHEIRKQLTADGYTVNYLEIENENIKIDAKYR